MNKLCSIISPILALLSAQFCLLACQSPTSCQGPSSCPGGTSCISGECTAPGFDQDKDGIQDWQDKCPKLAPDPQWPISDQTDADGDGVGDLCDNCPDVKNPAQHDADGDGTGDRCQGQVIFESEPFNDNPATAHLLFPGVTVEGIVGSPDPGPKPQADPDFYLIQAKEGQVLTLDAKTWPDTSYADPMLILTDDATGGARLVRTNDDFRGSPNAHMEVLIPQTGMYRVEVIDYVNYFYPDSPTGGIRYGYRLGASFLYPPVTKLEAIDQKTDLELEPGKIALFELDPKGPNLMAAYLSSEGICQTLLSAVDKGTGKILQQNSQRTDCIRGTQSRIRLCLQKKPVLIAIETIGSEGAPSHLSFELDMARSLDSSTQRASMLSGRQSLIFKLPQVAATRYQVSVESKMENPALEILNCTCGACAPSTAAMCQVGPDFSCGVQTLWQQGPAQLFAQVSRRQQADGQCAPVLADPVDILLQVSSKDLEPEQLPQQPPAYFSWTPPDEGAIGIWLIPGSSKDVLSIEAKPASASFIRPFVTIRDQELTILSRATPGPDGVARLAWAPVDESPLLLTVSDMLGGWGDDYQVDIMVSARELPSNDFPESIDASDTFEDATNLPDGDLLVEAHLGPKNSDKVDLFSLVLPPGKALTVKSWAAQSGIAPDTSLVLMDRIGRVLARGDDTGRDRLGRLEFAARDSSVLFLKLSLKSDDSSAYRLEITTDEVPSHLQVHPVGDDLSANEVMVHPEQDFNLDGEIDFGDQYIELLNTCPYSLELDRLLVQARGGSALFGALQLEPGEAILLFNGLAPADGLYPVEVFGLGNTEQWLDTGQDALVLLRSDPDGTGLDLQRTFIPMVQTDHSANRIVDGDPKRIMRDHINVIGAAAGASPGTRADGSLW